MTSNDLAFALHGNRQRRKGKAEAPAGTEIRHVEPLGGSLSLAPPEQRKAAWWKVEPSGAPGRRWPVLLGFSPRPIRGLVPRAVSALQLQAGGAQLSKRQRGQHLHSAPALRQCHTCLLPDALPVFHGQVQSLAASGRLVQGTVSSDVSSLSQGGGGSAHRGPGRDGGAPHKRAKSPG